MRSCPPSLPACTGGVLCDHRRSIQFCVGRIHVQSDRIAERAVGVSDGRCRTGDLRAVHAEENAAPREEEYVGDDFDCCLILIVAPGGRCLAVALGIFLRRCIRLHADNEVVCVARSPRLDDRKDLWRVRRDEDLGATRARARLSRSCVAYILICGLEVEFWRDRFGPFKLATDADMQANVRSKVRRDSPVTLNRRNERCGLGAWTQEKGLDDTPPPRRIPVDAAPRHLRGARTSR